ncbi:MAG: S-layer homology domain-containing protein [Oscillospiraceae bacterium]
MKRVKRAISILMCAALIIGLLPTVALAEGSTANIRVDGRGMAVSVEGATKVESSNDEYMFDDGAESVTVTITKDEDYHGIRVRACGENEDPNDAEWHWLRLESGVYTITDLTKFYEIEVFNWEPALYDNEFVVGYDQSDDFTVQLGGVTVNAWESVKTFTQSDLPLTITTSETPYKVVVRPNGSDEIELPSNGADNSYTYNPTTNVNAGFELIVYRTEAEYNFDTIPCGENEFIAEYQVRFDGCDPNEGCTVTYDVTPEESAVYGEWTRLVLANDTTQVKLTIAAAEGYVYEVWANGQDVTESVVENVYTWTVGENSDVRPEIVFRSKNDPGPGDGLTIELSGSTSVSDGTFTYANGTAQVMFVRESGDGAYNGSENQIALGDDVTAVKIILNAANGYQGVLRTSGNNPPVLDPVVNGSESTYTFERSAMEAAGNFVSFNIEFTGEPGGGNPGPGGNDPIPDNGVQFQLRGPERGVVSYKIGDAAEYTTVTNVGTESTDVDSDVITVEGENPVTVEFKVNPEETNGYFEVHIDSNPAPAEGEIQVTWDAENYNDFMAALAAGESVSFTAEPGVGYSIRVDFGQNQINWYTVSWGGGNVTVENGTVLAERVHLGDKTFTVNAEESGASDSDKIYPIEDIIGEEGQEGLGVYGLGYSDTDLFIGNEVEETVSIDFKFVPNYGYQLSDILTNEMDSLLRDFTASASEISTFNFPVRQGGSAHFNVVFAAAEDTIDATGSEKVTGATIANGQNATDSGNLKMTIADLNESAVSDDLKAKAGESALYLDMNLYQVVSKGGENGTWENQLENLSGTITVTLSVPAPAEGNSYYIIREHGEGTSKTYSRIAVDYDPATGTVTFETNKFSNYALAQTTDIVPDTEDTSSKVDYADVDTGSNVTWAEALPADASAATSVKLTVADSTPDETAKNALSEKAGGDVDPDKSFYLDLTMTASDGTNTTPITDLRQPVTVTLEVPAILASEKYVVVREHGTEYTALPCTYDRATSTLTVQSDKFSTYAIFVIPAYAATEISAVNVTVTAPTADLTVGETAVTVDPAAPYFVHEIEWSIVANKGSTESLDWVYGDDRFEAGKWYLAEITLYADFRYEFSDSVMPTVSGAALATAESEGDTLTVCAWFPVGGATDTRSEIASVAVTNVAVPAVGEGIYDVENTIEENATTGDGYFIDNVDIHEWVEDDDDNDYSYWDWTTSGSIAAGTAYGVELTLLAKTGYAFADTIAATINGRSAEVASRTADKLVLFLPFEQNVTITKVEVKSATWPIHGNPIDKSPENFYFDNYSFEHLAYTLESAEFQISTDGGASYNSLTALDTTFDTAKKYRVQAVLKAKDGATFASSVTGDFSGDGGVVCEVSADGKTCTVTRTCEVYNAVYSYKDSAPLTYVNGVTVHLPNPTAGQTYSLGSFGPTDDTGYLCGADAYVSWYEVPYVGSTGNIRRLTSGNTFESGKVYRMDVDFENRDGYRFAEGFTISFKQMDGSDSNYAMMSVTTDTARKKSYSIWYTVGAVADPQPVTFISIQGPALQEDGTVGTTSPSAFTVVSGNAVINSVYCYNGSLMINLTPASGYYFGRSVTVNYNIGTRNILAEVNTSSTHDRVVADVDLCIPVSLSGTFKAKDKVYDGTDSADLDRSEVTLTGLAVGDDVSLSVTAYTLRFRDPEVGENKEVYVFAQLSLFGADAWKYRLTTPYLYEILTASITAAPVTPPSSGGGSVSTYAVSLSDASNGAVTVSPANASAGTTVTVTATPDEGYELASLTVTDASGKELALTDKGDGKYTFTMPASKVTVSAAFSRVTLPFVDVPADAYYYDAVAWAVENKITEGTGDGTTFSPNAPCTRSQIVTFLWRAAGCPEPKSSVNPFTDVEEGSYYSKAVLWAVENGITIGTGDGSTFSPNLTCTRDQAVTFLWRAVEKPAATAEKSFTDVPADAYYAPAVQWALANDITTGTGDGTTFSPADDCTRSQIVSFLCRTYAK